VQPLDERLRSLDDARRLAQRRMPRFLFESIGSGSAPERTLRENLRAFEEIEFRPRAAVNVVDPDTSTMVLGHRIDLPVMIAPTGNLRVFHTGGEPAVARAAGARGTIQMVSCFTGYPIEEVTAAATGPIFFDIYFAGGRSNTEIMIDRAKRAGCAALVITVDWAAAHQRERNVRDRLDRPVGLDMKSAIRFGPAAITRPAWTLDFLRGGRRMDNPMWMIEGRPATPWEMSQSILKQAPTWSDLPWIRELWDGPIILKGILHPDDALRAVDEGVEAIVVSNHGGRNVDGSPATLRVLPEIAQIVNDRLEVYFDSGIRRGADVVKAIALGARACLIGRSNIWGLAAAGEAGVGRVLDLYKSEVATTLSSLGCQSVTDLGEDQIVCRGESQ
jgi:isopentenyl diphosphate isomerase/L-lactate dehydrogenase-like FMN-dependent dehydrogenase